jgi:hypothetical protein
LAAAPSLKAASIHNPYSKKHMATTIANYTSVKDMQPLSITKTIQLPINLNSTHLDDISSAAGEAARNKIKCRATLIIVNTMILISNK